MLMIQLSIEQARRFLLSWHGLAGPCRFFGKDGVMAFIRQVGCVQFDPIDVCGKNAELVLQSRIPGFSKRMLYELLYEDRRLIDYFDKNLAVFPVEDWKYFNRTREYYRKHGKSKVQVDAVASRVFDEIHRRGFVRSKDLDLPEKVDWHWSHTRLSRAALESLYFQGRLAIHHKVGTAKYYAIAEDILPREALSDMNPCRDDDAFLQWWIRRRIGAVGLLWNRPSDAWLGIDGLRSEGRRQAFASLLEAGSIRPVRVIGVPEPFYYLPEAQPLMDAVIADMSVCIDSRVDTNTGGSGGDTLSDMKTGTSESSPRGPRMELIAPLDNLLWDRRLIEKLFDFSYKWEIYTPAAQREYGYYVLPVLYGEQFIGRAELVCDRKNRELNIQGVWLEPGIVFDDQLKLVMRECFERFATFNDCAKVVGRLRPVAG